MVGYLTLPVWTDADGNAMLTIPWDNPNDHVWFSGQRTLLNNDVILVRRSINAQAILKARAATAYN